MKTMDEWIIIKLLPCPLHFRDKIIEEAKRFPEYVKDTFSLRDELANPSSFHNETVRQLRTLAHEKFIYDDYKQCIDRLVITNPNVTVKKDVWHRKDNDEQDTFTGWINLDTAPQTFTFIPGSHRNNMKIHHDTIKYKAKTIIVPPGGLLLYNSKLIQSKPSMKLDYKSIRLFITFTKYSKTSAYTLHTQGVPKLYNKRSIPIYNYAKKIQLIINFSTNLKDQIREPQLINGKVYNIVPRYLKSLKEYALPLYKPYDKNEMKMYL